MEKKDISSLKIAYFFFTYPSLHKTFVDREIFALRDMGVNIKIYSLHRPKVKLSPYQQAIKDEIVYISDFGYKARYAANIRYALRWPGKYFSTLSYLLTRPHPKYHSRDRTIRYFVRSVFLTSLLEKDPPDHIHAHFLNESVTAGLVAQRFLGIPYSATVHASDELFVTPRMVREKLSEAKFIATCTDYNRDYLEKISKGKFDQKLRVIYHGLDTNQFHRVQHPQEDVPIIVSVGQLKERKGFHYLVDACAMLHQHNCNFICRIVGEGPMRPILEEKIAQYGLADQVQLLGALPQDEVLEQYQQASIFTLPAVLAKDGDRDGIPNVILEAMAMQLPVVSTRHSAIPEAIEDGVNGVLIPPEDPAALAQALENLLSDPELRQRLGDRGRETVMQQFNPQKNAQMLINAFTT
jgi:glycosyltransferase involved in cell wall biosynthesis